MTSPGAQRLSEKLTSARQKRFVGRQAELELFRTALLAEEPPFVVLHIYGPGGVGKTTLLYELARLAVAYGRPLIHLDGHHLEPNPAAFALAVQQAEAIPPGADAMPANMVLFVDTYELLTALDGWLRHTFLPQLPGQTLVVIAGRQAPNDAWLSDSGWATLTRVISLGNLRPKDGQAYLAARDIPAEQHAAILEFTHCHPLALCLMADLYQQNSAPVPMLPANQRDIIHILLERFLRDIPSALHRQALELCVICRTTNEALLAERFDRETAYTLFQWLRQLSFMEQGPYGLFPHDLVREVMDADPYWRNPPTYTELQAVALAYLRTQLQQVPDPEKPRLQLDIIYVNRRLPTMQPFFAWDAVDTVYAEPATPDTFPAILDMVHRHEGEASAAIARHWQKRQPQAFLVYRTTNGEVYGFMLQLALHKATAEDKVVDPAVRAALAYVRAHHPPGPGEAMSHLRFWMAGETYQEVSPAINLTAANCVTHWVTTPRLVWSFVTMSNPNFMAPHLESIHFRRTPAADFVIGERIYGVFSHNWALQPVAKWHQNPRYSDTEAVPTMPAEAPTGALSEAEFAAAVRLALRDYTRPDLLATNPLLQSGLLPAEDQTPAALQTVFRQAVAGLSQNPKDAKFHRALWYTYIEPEGTQEKVAERLDLPFNTYRYRLSIGLERLTAVLWYRLHAKST